MFKIIFILPDILNILCYLIPFNTKLDFLVGFYPKMGSVPSSAWWLVVNVTMSGIILSTVESVLEFSIVKGYYRPNCLVPLHIGL